MRIGELYQANLDPTIGDEIPTSRQVVLLNPGHAKNLRLAVVVPVTAWRQRWEKNPFFLTITPGPRHGLRKKFAVDCFQIRALSHGRFIKKLGTLRGEELDRVKKAIALIFDIEPEHCQL